MGPILDLRLNAHISCRCLQLIKSLRMPNIKILFIKKDKYLRIAILAHDIAYILEKTRKACSIVHIGLFFITF